jgi:DNA mismatch repair protein MutL
MNNIIRILPDSVANQIAAGEVVQRPASVVKELTENSIDAGATHIQVIIKQAGKYLIQIIDDGGGMSEVDARLAFERHATSKITAVNDLFALHTFGFRGEALASIAAVAEVEVKTRTSDAEMGTHLIIRGSTVDTQEAAVCPQGTSISVRNLFFNVPARRRFLKTDAAEYRHIETELRRVALCHPEVAIALFNEDKQVLDLPIGNVKNRIIKTLDTNASLKKGLIEIHNTTEIVDVQGFVSIPEVVSNRDKQFLFVNGRYFQSAYFRSAIVRAYEKLMPAGNEPAYFVYFTVDAARLDVNIHPSKTEIKFDDEHLIWQLLHSAVRAALGQYGVIPSINFEGAKNIDINIPITDKNTAIAEPQIAVNPAYNPFTAQIESDSQRYSHKDWRDCLRLPHDQRHPFLEQSQTMQIASKINFDDDNEQTLAQKFMQIGGKYIVASNPQGLTIIHQARAHRRILYEQFLRTLQDGVAPQSELFPQNIPLDDSDHQLLLSLAPNLQKLGLVIKDTGNSSIAVQAVPAFVQNKDAAAIIEDLLSTLHRNEETPLQKEQHALAALLAHATAINTGKTFVLQEMSDIYTRLFACEHPHICPNGKPVFKNLSVENLEKWMDR